MTTVFFIVCENGIRRRRRRRRRRRKGVPYSILE